MKIQRQAAKTILFLVLSASLGSAGQLAAQTPVTARVVTQSQDWRLVDTVPSGTPTTNTQMWAVKSAGTAVASMPVSQTQKDLLNEAIADDPGASSSENIYMSQELLAAMEQPTFPKGYEAYIVKKDVKPPAPGSKFSFGCYWDSTTRNRTWSYSQSLLSQNLPFSGSVQGQLNLDLPVTGQVTVAATYKIRKCAGIPVGFKFVSATASGNAAITGTGDLQATASASANWDHEWQLADPELGDITFTIGWIPVRIVFNLPIYAGASFNAAVSGQVSAHLGATASGTFNYTCTTDTCTGTDNFTDNFNFTGPTGSVTATLDARAYARVMLRVSLYSENIAYVEGGLKAYARAGLWGYYGNACGDADGDGTNETVQALVADLGWGYQFAYGLGGWLLPDQLNYTGGSDYPLGWVDLLGTGGSTVFTPMISGSASATQGSPATYVIKMRPCYPYTQPVNFTMTPGTWTGVAPIAPPSGSASVQTTFQAPGNQTIVATVTGDSAGRSFQGSTSRVIAVAPNPPAPPNSPAATALSPTSVLFTWRDNSNNETQFLIERRLSPSGSFTQIGSVGANVTSYTDNTVQPSTSYDYHVRATNSAGASGFSNTVTVTTPAPAVAAPSNLTATVLSATTVQLSWWDNSNNETQFGIERRTTPSGTFSQIGTVGANVTSYTDTTAQPATSYEYRVRALNGTGSSTYSNTAAASTSGAPAAPSNLTAAYNTANNTITLSWTDNSNNELGFTAQFSYSGSAFADMGSVGANVTTYTTGPNPPIGTYQFRVYAYNGLSSDYSNTAFLLVAPPPAPTTSIAWIQTAESTWGAAGTLTVGGFAANGTGTVQLVWRERSSSGVWGDWITDAYQATPSPDTTWSNTISSGNPTDACHWFDAYSVYSGVTSAVFHYTGAPGCP